VLGLIAPQAEKTRVTGGSQPGTVVSLELPLSYRSVFKKSLAVDAALRSERSCFTRMKPQVQVLHRPPIRIWSGVSHFHLLQNRL